MVWCWFWTYQLKSMDARRALAISRTAHVPYNTNVNITRLIWRGSIHIPAGLGSRRLSEFIFQWQVHHIGSESRPHQLMEAWHSIISLYSRCLLTHPEDKLHALGGVAEVFHWQLQQPCLVGLWGGDLLPGLLIWRSDVYAIKSVIYIGPSWSWSALKSPVSYHELPGDGSYGCWQAVLQMRRMKAVLRKRAVVRIRAV